MKKLLILPVILFSATGFLVSSCTKSNPANEIVQNVAQPVTLSLVADNWVRDTDGSFVSRFPNILSPVNGRSYGNPNVSVYVVLRNAELKINSPIGFNGGKLSAEINSADLIIRFRQNETTLPFAYLNIKVVIG